MGNRFARARWLLRGGIAIATMLVSSLRCDAAEPVAKIEISGMGWFGNREARKSLERLLRSELGPVLEANAIEDGMFLLMSAVREKGYLKPTIRIETTGEDGKPMELTLDESMTLTVPRTMRARGVHFMVDRGVRYFTKEVRIEGLGVLPEKTARAFFVGDSVLFTTKGSRAYTPGRLARGVDSLTAELHQRGYAEAAIEASDVRIDDHTGEVNVTLKVVEGVRWQVRGLRVESSAGVNLDVAALRRFEGLPWSESLEQDVATETRKRLFAQGYPDARVRVTREVGAVSDRQKEVELTAHPEPGQRVTMGEVKFEGAGDVRVTVLRRRVHAKAGELLNVLELEQARYRIGRLGVFDRVNLRLEPSDGELRSPVFAVQPGRRVEVNLLAGYGSYEQLRGGIEVRQFNLFGLAHQTRGQLIQSMKSTRGEYSYTVPEIFGESVDGTAKIFGLRREEVAFERKEYGATVALAAPLRFFGANATAGYTFQFAEPGQPIGDTGQAFDDKVTVASLDGGLTRDRRDNPLAPRRGYRWFAQIEAASRTLGGQAEYQRSEFGGSYHTPWGDGRWVHLSAAHGVITTWGTSDALLPVPKRFFPGGDGSIRGYRTGQAAPRGADGKFVGAKSYLSASVELEQALTPKWSGVIFGDALGTATQLRRYPFDETLYAAGVGLRYRTLIGPIRAEYGWNLKRRPDDPRGTFLISVGVPF